MRYMLLNAKNAIIRIQKLIDYSLNLEKDANKALAFQYALGYTKKNASKLIVNNIKNINCYNTVSKGNNGYGDIYEIIMELTGENGKTANVLTSWIIENGYDYPRLTNVYITKKKPVR